MENLPKFAEKKAVTSPETEIPKQAKPYLPKRGFLFVSGGFMSDGSRLVVDLDQKKLSYAENRGNNSTPYGKLPKEDKFLLNVYELANILTLANQIWSSNNRSFMRFPPQPTADYNVILFLADQGSYRVIKSYGPPVGTVEKLHEYVWELVEKNKVETDEKGEGVELKRNQKYDWKDFGLTITNLGSGKWIMNLPAACLGEVHNVHGDLFLPHRWQSEWLLFR